MQRTRWLLLAILWTGRADAVTLADAVRAAEENNVDLGMAREDIVQREIERDRAWSVLQPRISGAVGFNLTDNEIVVDIPSLGGPVVLQKKSFWTAIGSVQQPLLLVRSIPLIAGTYHSADAAVLDVARARHVILTGVVRGYYDLGVARLGLEVSERSLEARQEQLELVRALPESDPDRRLEEVQAELQVSRAERAVSLGREQIVAAETAFERLTGLPGDSEFVTPEPLRPPESLEKALEDAMTYRPDYKAAEERVVSARLAKVATGLEWVPRIDGLFAYHYNGNTEFSDRMTFWNAGIVASIDLWDGGKRRADFRQAASAMRMAELRGEDLRLRIEEEVIAAWGRYRHAELALAAVTTEVDLAEESLTLARESHAAGRLSYFEFKEAEVERYRTLLSLIEEHENRDLAVIDLLVAMGVPPIE